VILMPGDYDTWLDGGIPTDVLRGLLRPFDPELMKAYEVNRVVNSVKNDVEECIEPLKPAPESPQTRLNL
jgi:putative SOS response-associated peptidase YedK